jgi:hypothetical protein
MRYCGIIMANKPGSRSNDAWRGNGPVQGTSFYRYSLEDVEFLRANCHLTASQAAEALSVKYGRTLNPKDINKLAQRHKVKLAAGKRGESRDSSGSTPHDSFYVKPEFLAKAYKLPPVLEKKYSDEIKGEEDD